MLWKGSVEICVIRYRFEGVIEEYCSAGAVSANDLNVEFSYDDLNQDILNLHLNREDIILLATKFKNLKKLCFDR